jgi:N-methylhydantoinase B/oxoprolinase/acetone carboxylase alpha subunit
MPDTTALFDGSPVVRATKVATAKAVNLVAVSTVAATIPAVANVGNGKLKRVLQNQGTQAVLYSLGGTASATNYHGTLAGGTGAKDGKGGSVDLSDWPGAVSVITEASTSVVSVQEIIVQ